MNDRLAQKEELEALEAIFGDAVRIDSLSGAETISVAVLDDEVHLGELKVVFPVEYPSRTCPVFEIKSEFCAQVEDLAQISSMLEKSFVPREVVVFQWVDLLQGWLLEKKLAKELLERDEELCGSSKAVADVQGDVQRPISPEGIRFTTSSAQTSPHSQSTINLDTGRVQTPEIYHGEPLLDRKSTFQAHVSSVHSKQEVAAVMASLKENRKIAVATHNIYAYRIFDQRKGVYLHDCDDDGETAAGSRLMHLLVLMDVCNAVVVVSRWYGGIHLGPDRFKHINSCARSLIQETGTGLEHKTSREAKERNPSKQHRKKKN